MSGTLTGFFLTGFIAYLALTFQGQTSDGAVVESQQCDCSAMESDIEDLQARIGMMTVVNNELAVLKDKVGMLTARESIYSAFTGTRFTNIAGVDEIIPFEPSDEFPKGAFNTKTSKYRCRISGMYYVGATLLRWDDNRLSVKAMVSNRTVWYSRQTNSDPESTNSDIPVSNSAVVFCNEGDDIYLQMQGHSSIGGCRSQLCTTLTIFMSHAFYFRSP